MECFISKIQHVQLIDDVDNLFGQLQASEYAFERSGLKLVTQKIRNNS